MSIFDNIKEDRERGTDGEWKTGQCSWDEDTKDVRYTLHDVKTATPADARRIARVPQLERIALAAAELADSIVGDWQEASYREFQEMQEALAAFREACK